MKKCFPLIYRYELESWWIKDITRGEVRIPAIPPIDRKMAAIDR
jgi:hypothetical protein